MRNASRWLLVTTLSGLSAAAQAEAPDDQVLSYRDREGRTVYTNLEGAADSTTGVAKRVSLPPLSSVDFQQTDEKTLSTLDQDVTRVHEALQGGERCDKIRADSRLSLRTEIWQAHRSELAMSGALLALATLILLVWRRRELRMLMPLGPFIGAGYLGYLAVDRAKQNQAALHEGLSACTAELPDGEGDAPRDVRSRLSNALEVQATIDRVYEARARRADRIMQMR